MQEQINEKTVALSIKTAKLTAEVLQKSIRKMLNARKNKAPKCSGQAKLLHLEQTYSCLCLASNGVSPALYECGLTWLYHKNT